MRAFVRNAAEQCQPGTQLKYMRERCTEQLHQVFITQGVQGIELHAGEDRRIAMQSKRGKRCYER